MRDVFRVYNFHEIRTPIFEETQLFARSVGEETDIVSKEMFTWVDGERFNERKLIDAWLETNRADNPARVQAGRVNRYATGIWLADLNDLGVIHVLRGMQGPPPANLPLSVEEFVAFAANVSSDTINNLKKARNIVRERYANDFRHHRIQLRLVVPDGATKSSPWVDREDVEVEGFAGDYFSSSQSLTLRPENTAGVVRAYIEHKLWDRGLEQALLHWAAVPARASAERTLPPVLSDRRGGHRPAERGQRISGARRGDSGIAGNVARPPRHRKLDAAIEFGRLPQRSRCLQRSSAQSARAGGRKMCADCQRRAVTNPLRVFDCKVPADQPIIETLPRISQFLDEPCRKHFEQVQEILKAVGVEFQLNDRLVRGLDYYSRTAFEFTHGALGAQNAILGGGRYDGLSESLGGPSAPGIGFAIGEDRLVLALKESADAVQRKPDVYIAPLGAGMDREAARLARELRRHDVVADLGDETFRLKKSFETASKLGARFILIVGENEVKAGAFALKNLESGEQVSVPRAELAQKDSSREHSKASTTET